MHQTPWRPRGTARRLHIRRGPLIDSLESRVMLAADAETRWMITAAGGTPDPGPVVTVSENLPDQNGYARTTDPAALTLSGIMGSGGGVVRVNGVEAGPSAIPEGWTLSNTGNALGLTPGINRVQVRLYDISGENELARNTIDIWYDDGNMQSVSGTLAGNNTWSAAAGPYYLTDDLTIPAGSSLTIEPGTTVFMASNVELVVNGGLTASGTDFQHVRFTRLPSASTGWGDIRLINTAQPNRLSYADIEYANAGGVDQVLRIDRAAAYLDHVHFDHANRQYVDVTNASIDIRSSIFPGAAGVELFHYSGNGANLPTGGFAIFKGNVFGPTTGYNDIIDFTGSQRPGPIVQFYDNWFLGGSDDAIDMDSTDAWIEGNVFMHFHQDGSRDSKAHAVSTGNDFNVTTEITVIRNYFYDVDHAAIIKDGAYGTFINNTIVGVHKLNNGANATTAVINLYEPRSGQYQGRGVRLEGNIIQDVSQMFELPQPFPSGHPQIVQIQIDDSILPAGTTFPSSGVNVVLGPGVKYGDPQLLNTSNVKDPTVDFALMGNSPAIGAGPNGVDMGAVIPGGISLSGEPDGPANDNDVILTVGPLFGSGLETAGYPIYKYRVNEGAWSAERPMSTPIELNDLPDGQYTVYAIGQNDAGLWQSESAATASRTFTIDTMPPTIGNALFDINSPAHLIDLAFSELISSDPALTDPTLTNLTTGEVIRGEDDLHWMPGLGQGAQITFPNLPDGRLSDGRYRLTLHAAGMSDAAGNLLDGNADGVGGDDFTFDFVFMAGDANGDGAVNFSDLVILAQNYGQPDRRFDEGDFNYSGGVDFNDLVILAQKYNSSLPVAASVVNAPALAAPASARAPAQRSAKAAVEAAPAPVRQAPSARSPFAVRRIG